MTETTWVASFRANREVLTCPLGDWQLETGDRDFEDRCATETDLATHLKTHTPLQWIDALQAAHREIADWRTGVGLLLYAAGGQIRIPDVTLSMYRPDAYEIETWSDPDRRQRCYRLVPVATDRHRSGATT